MTEISSLVNATHTAEEDLARATDSCSARIDQILRIIGVIDKNLQQQRERFEEIQTRHEGLALQYTQLGKSLDSATTELTQNFAAIISDLVSDPETATLLAEDARAPATAANLAPETPEIQPVPECVGEAQTIPDEEQVNLETLQAGFNRMLRKRR